jgi:hypothetical protein
MPSTADRTLTGSYVIARARFQHQSPRSRLESLLAFLRRDLRPLYVEERRTAWYDLVGIVLASSYLKVDVDRILSEEVEHLAQWQRELRDFLRVTVVDQQRYALTPFFQSPGRLVFLMAFAKLCDDAKARTHLRRCQGQTADEGCGAWFLRQRRQLFCSTACAQRARNDRKKEDTR